jgi:hypothetical protein
MHLLQALLATPAAAAAAAAATAVQTQVVLLPICCLKLFSLGKHQLTACIPHTLHTLGILRPSSTQ